MCLKLLKMGFCIRKLELLIMRVRKFGKISLMTQNLIFGVWAVLCMKCAH